MLNLKEMRVLGGGYILKTPYKTIVVTESFKMVPRAPWLLQVSGMMGMGSFDDQKELWTCPHTTKVLTEDGRFPYLFGSKRWRISGEI
jgi:hypothetical protein